MAATTFSLSPPSTRPMMKRRSLAQIGCRNISAVVAPLTPTSHPSPQIPNDDSYRFGHNHQAWKKKPVGSRGGGAVASVIRKSPNATVPSEHALSNSRSNSNSNNPSPLNGFSAPSRLRGEISCLDPDLPPVFRPRTSADLQSSFWAGSNGEGGGIPSLKRASPIYDSDGEDSDDDHIVGLCCSESPTKRTRSSSQQQQQHQTAYFHPESLWNLPPSVTPSHVDIAAEGCFDFSNNEGMVMTENLCWSSAVRESVVDGSFKLTLE